MSLNIPKFTEDVNIHQSLEDQPSLTAKELKERWDKPANDIKDYLNKILITTLEADIPKEIKDSIEKAIKDIADELEKMQRDLSETLENLQKEIDNQLETGLSKVTSSEDFVITTNNSVVLTTSRQYGEYKVSKNATFKKEGYKPIGVIGYNIPFNYNERWEIRQCYLENATNGSARVYIEGKPTTNKGDITYTTTVSIHILWVKIR